VVWTDPLISIGKSTFLADALQHAGAVSVVDSSQNWPQINLEEAVRLQPEFLVFAESHPENVEQTADSLADRPGWRLLDAVKHHRYAFVSDAVNRPAPRIASAIADLARQLHPEAFEANPQSHPAQPRPVAPSAPPRAREPREFVRELSWSTEQPCAR
jgi:iron complex transport system substrate-binding protein